MPVISKTGNLHAFGGRKCERYFIAVTLLQTVLLADFQPAR